MKNLLQKIPRSLLIVLVIIFAAKVLLFGVGYAVTYTSNPQFIPNTPLGTVPSTPLNILMYQFAKPLAAQDTYHYLYIAQYWYDSNPANDQYNFIVFFPLYPILINLITVDYNYVNLSALLVSNASSIVALLFLFKLTKLDFTEGVAQKAVLFLSVFPTAYFLSVPYTEGLFFALVIASVYYARLSKWPLAGILSFLAALTRLGGLLLMPVLFVEYLHQAGWKPKNLLHPNFAWIFAAIGGFLVYLNINYQVTGNVFEFVVLERVHWFSTLDPIRGLTQAINVALTWSYPSNLLLGIAPIAFAIFGLCMIMFGIYRRLRPSYLVYMLLSWMLSVAYSWWISPPRYIMAMFPMFILMGLITKNKIVNIAITGFSTAWLCYFTALFSLGYTVF